MRGLKSLKGSRPSDGGAERKGPGRPQRFARTGPTYRLAEWLNAHMDERLGGMTRGDLAIALGYDRPNIFSMWTAGATRVPLDRLARLARLMGVDLALLFPLWLEQYVGDGPLAVEIMETASRTVTRSEMALIETLRAAGGGLELPDLDGDQLAAIRVITRRAVAEADEDPDADPDPGTGTTGIADG